MTKQHFIRAAELIKAINDGKWTNDAPPWSPIGAFNDYEIDTPRYDHVRAIQTAEVFMRLFTEHNPRFNRTRFLDACGLGPKLAPTWRIV